MSLAALYKNCMQEPGRYARSIVTEKNTRVAPRLFWAGVVFVGRPEFFFVLWLVQVT